jgi:lantibiotic leader peptide-processing serine protease
MRKLKVLAGAAAVLTISMAPPARADTNAAVDPATAAANCTAFFGPQPAVDPLSACLWGMRAVQAGPSSFANATGAGVSVGVIDSGVDFNHGDLEANIDVARACSFIFSNTPTADPGEVANGDCSNKAAVQDLNGHGTHVSTIIAAPDNGIGVVGVAPEATIVPLKACTIAGFCFADSVAAALRYAGDQGLDVVNLSLFADPFLYYCKSDAEQKAILTTLETAARYAQQRGVVIVASAGNELDDLGHPVTDETSPDWPPDTNITREVRNNCRVAPAELNGVLTVSAVGPTTLASYSNVGGSVEVTAPGGDAAQTPGTTFGRILAGWSSTDATGTWEALSAANRAVLDGTDRYVWISGTSMSSPHAAGVATLVKELHPNWNTGAVVAAVKRSATPMSCPANWPADDVRQCHGNGGNTSFFGSGMVNALGASSI